MYRLLIAASVFIAAGSFWVSDEVLSLWLLGLAVLVAVWGRIDQADKHKEEIVRAVRGEEPEAVEESEVTPAVS